MAAINKSSSSRADFSQTAVSSCSPTPTKNKERPINIVEKAFQWLDYRDLSYAMSVSREWRTLARGPNPWASLICRHFCILPENFLSKLHTQEQELTRKIQEEATSLNDGLKYGKEKIDSLEAEKRSQTIALKRIEDTGNKLQQFVSEQVDNQAKLFPALQQVIQEHSLTRTNSISKICEEIERNLKERVSSMQANQKRLDRLQEDITKIYEDLNEFPWRAFVRQMHQLDPQTGDLRETAKVPPSEYAQPIADTPQVVANSSKTIFCAFTRLQTECTITAPGFFPEPVTVNLKASIGDVFVDDDGVHILSRMRHIYHFDPKTQETHLKFENKRYCSDRGLDPRGYFDLIKIHNHYIYARITKDSELCVTLVDTNGKRTLQNRSFYDRYDATKIIPVIEKIKGGFAVRLQFHFKSGWRPDDLVYCFPFMRPRRSLKETYTTPRSLNDYLYPTECAMGATITLLESKESDFVLTKIAEKRSARVPKTSTVPTTKLSVPPNTSIGSKLRMYFNIYEKQESNQELTQLRDTDIQEAVQELFTRTIAPFEVILPTPDLTKQEEERT